jgi:hypothetical protein
MSDKFVKYYSNDEKIKELSEYVHQNFKMIMTKMASEMRRKLDIKPDMENSEGYQSLMYSLAGRMFNEMVYCLGGMSQSNGISVLEIVPVITWEVLFKMIEGNFKIDDVRESLILKNRKDFEKYYTTHIDELRKNIEALPK